MYEIVMPQLSDSMDEGKLISWKVAVGDKVHAGDVIAEVESDKAIMEVQSFKEGVVASLEVKEDAEVPVGTVIAHINTDKNTTIAEEAPKPQEKPKEEKKKTEPPHKVTLPPKQEVEIKQEIKIPHQEGVSPKARAKAAAYGVDLTKMVQKDAKKQLHAEDIEAYVLERYFTPQAYKLLQEYQLSANLFQLDHKIDITEVQNYIKEHELALPQPLSAMQKAIIANVENAVKKPVFHIYEKCDAHLLEKYSEVSITTWLIKIFAKVMIQHPAFRSVLDKESIKLMPNAAISVAVANEKDLYMPVVHDANKASIQELTQQLHTFKEKLKKRAFTQADMQGSTFGISNLGMLGVERFDAMINKDDSAIAAIGAIKNGYITITLTCDHRYINGYEAGLFMRDVKSELQNPLNFKENENV